MFIYTSKIPSTSNQLFDLYSFQVSNHKSYIASISIALNIKIDQVRFLRRALLRNRRGSHGWHILQSHTTWKVTRCKGNNATGTNAGKLESSNSSDTSSNIKKRTRRRFFHIEPDRRRAQWTQEAKNARQSMTIQIKKNHVSSDGRLFLDTFVQKTPGHHNETTRAAHQTIRTRRTGPARIRIKVAHHATSAAPPTAQIHQMVAIQSPQPGLCMTKEMYDIQSLPRFWLFFWYRAGADFKETLKLTPAW